MISESLKFCRYTTGWRFLWIFLLLPVCLSAQLSVPDIHTRSIVVDLHSDVLLQVLRGADISKKLTYGQVDLVRLREGGVDVQFFAIWPDPKKYLPDRMYHQSVYMISRLKTILAENPDKAELALSVPDIERIVAQGKLAACIGVEGGTAIENDLNKIDSLYQMGARYLGLTWNDSPPWATSGEDEYKLKDGEPKGLTDFGRQVIRRMNDLGMIVDLSHSGEQTFRDVIETTRKPVIASHSDVYALRHHYRNLKDWQIREIAKNGGVIGMNFYPEFLDYSYTDAIDKALEDGSARLDSMRQVFGTDYLGYRAYRSNFIKSIIDTLPTVARVVDHMDYIIGLVGDDYVAIGSDFDGITIAPKGLEDVSQLPNLTREMIKRGYSDKRIEKILGGNFLRVMRAQGN